MSQSKDLSRRDLLVAAGSVTAAAAAIPALQGAPSVGSNPGERVKFGMVGTGSRGQYLLKHLKEITNGQCVALCDINQDRLNAGAGYIGNKPRLYRDYRELLDQKDVEAVFVTTPLFEHYRVTKDALDAGKHVFCEKCLVFKPEEVHGLRAHYAKFPKQVLQTGLQRRYSYFYQTVKQMVDKGILGKVYHISAQWHRNMINKPSRLWTMKPGGESNIENWRLYRSMSGGLPAELTSHQVDVADWMFGNRPDFVMGLGTLDILKDGRNVYDNVQLIYSYPEGRKMTYSSISTSQFLPMFNGTRAEMGEMIMGTEGTIQITVGGDDADKKIFTPPIAWWYMEPPKTVTATKPGEKKKEAVTAAASMAPGEGARGPIPILTADLELGKNDSFLTREMKFARRWLTSKGIMMQEESRNPVDIELESFFNACRTLERPKADIETGMADSVAVMLSNLAMDENRKVYFNEIDKMGTTPAVTTAPAKPGKVLTANK